MARARTTQHSTIGMDTKTRIIEATMETLRTEGIVGTSVRAIARTGDFNQALIHYHFGSISNLLISTLQFMGDQRHIRYAERLGTVSSFGELVHVAAELHEQDVATGQTSVLNQIIAGSCGDPELQERLKEPFQPWVDMVEDIITRLLGDSPLATLVPAHDVANAMAALFLGIETLSIIDPDDAARASLFTMFETLGGVLEALLHAGVMPTSVER